MAGRDPWRATVDRIVAGPAFAAAVATLRAEHERTVEDIVRLTEIPAPPFAEEVRARAYMAMLADHGLDDVEMDGVGNVMGLRRGTGNGPLVVVAAHLDTVFPAGTDVTVRREGTKLFAPGVGDDTRSLAVNLALVRAMDAAGIRTEADLLILGDVGEEGLGDLRGVRHVFREGRYRDRVKAFLTVDFPEMNGITVAGVGSRRYRVTFRGPGGHSWMDFGRVSPMQAMATTVVALGRLAVPEDPRTTLAATVVSGGTSINAIPHTVTLQVDLRSEDAGELARLDARFRSIVTEAVAAENTARDTGAGPVTADLDLVGDREAGRQDPGNDLIRAATAALGRFGFDATGSSGSTDANVPISLGSPAIRIGSGGHGGLAHTLDEWIDVEIEASVRGMSATLATILAVAGIADG
jgi:acetylornithine deacetylase/succinyl-diaminopimelate desuccinylase-like protein